MAYFIDQLKRYFEKPVPIKPGIYHYQAPTTDSKHYRFHLRIEPNNRGILLLNASTVLHLNETASEYLYHYMQGLSTEQIIENVTKRYQVNKVQAVNDFKSVLEKIDTLIQTPDLDPVTYMEIDPKLIYSETPPIPYRLDCALSYRLPERHTADLAPTHNVTKELSTEEWIGLFKQAWNIGIPHIILTGGEPTLCDDLIEFIEAIERNGQVCGLLTDGLRFVDKSYLNELLKTGLDHVLLIWQGDQKEKFLSALENSLAEDIYTAVHVTITPNNQTTAGPVINQLAHMGVHGISLSASSKECFETLNQSREAVADTNTSLIWDLPVPYSINTPINLEVHNQQYLQGAGRNWLYVEPDGDVLPSQGVFSLLGNLLTDTLEEINRARILHLDNQTYEQDKLG